MSFYVSKAEYAELEEAVKVDRSYLVGQSCFQCGEPVDPDTAVTKRLLIFCHGKCRAEYEKEGL